MNRKPLIFNSVNDAIINLSLKDKILYRVSINKDCYYVYSNSATEAKTKILLSLFPISATVVPLNEILDEQRKQTEKKVKSRTKTDSKELAPALDAVPKDSSQSA